MGRLFLYPLQIHSMTAVLITLKEVNLSALTRGTKTLISYKDFMRISKY